MEIDPKKIIPFPRGPGPLVSVLLPTRGRPSELCLAVDSCVSLARDPSQLEFIFKADDDDKETIELLNKLHTDFGNKLNFKALISPRGRGYHDMHHWINNMCEGARGDWVIIFNDDTRMLTQDWDEILRHSIIGGPWHGVHEVCCFVAETEGQPDAQGFFFLRKSVVDLLGHFSLIPHNDTWVIGLMKMVNSLFSLPIIKIRHLADVGPTADDATRRESLEARQTTEYTVEARGLNTLRLKDAFKLQEVIDQKQSIKDKQASAKNLPPEILAKYTITDADTEEFLKFFKEPPGGRVLEVGAHDEPVANILSEAGYSVTGVDLREYNPHQDLKERQDPGTPNYEYVREDFCNLPLKFLQEHLETYDIAICLSAVEHFGLGTYNEGADGFAPFYDVVAMRKVWEFLKVGGAAYVTVPFGGRMVVVGKDWRIYDEPGVLSRIVQDFSVEEAKVFIADDIDINGVKKKRGDPITPAEAAAYTGAIPHISVLMKLRKTPVKRLAPDGR